MTPKRTDHHIRHKTCVGTLTEVASVFDVPTTSVPSYSNPEGVSGTGSSTAECPPLNLHIGTDHLSASEIREVNALVAVNLEVFAHSPSDLGRTHLTEMKINTGDHPPIHQLPRRMSPAQREEIAEHVNTMLKQGVIEPSVSLGHPRWSRSKKKMAPLSFALTFAD